MKLSKNSTPYFGCSDGDRFKVVEQNSYNVNLLSLICSCHKWLVYGILCKHACTTIKQTDLNVHRLPYAETIFLIKDNNKPTNNTCELLLWPPIIKRQVGGPSWKRIEQESSIMCELHYNRCYEAGHNQRSCNASKAN